MKSEDEKQTEACKVFLDFFYSDERPRSAWVDVYQGQAFRAGYRAGKDAGRSIDYVPYAWCIILALLLLFSLTACSRTSAYLPVPPTPQGERLTLEKQPTAWAEVTGFLGKAVHPEEAKDWPVIGRFIAWLGPGH